MQKSELLLSALEFINITHHSKGRLRLDISSKIKNINGFDEINFDEIFNIEGINEVKVNKILGKVTILYDFNIFSASDFEDLLNAKDVDSVKLALRKFGINEA